MNIVSESPFVHCDRQIPCPHEKLSAAVRRGNTIQGIKRSCDFVKDAQILTAKI